MFTRVIQYVNTAKSESDAERMFSFLRHQVDYRGGRILPPSPGRPEWKVQAFFEDVNVDERLLPDGCRRVLAPRRWLKVAAITCLALSLLASTADARGSGGSRLGRGHSHMSTSVHTHTTGSKGHG
jgi:hypothetical protein